MIDSYLKVMSNYVTFSGRLMRKDYWLYILTYFIIMVVANIIDGLIGYGYDGDGLIAGLVALIHFLPSLAAGFRRLHDIDRTAWWYLIILIPVIGWLVILFFHIQPGTVGANRFGQDPRETEAA
ncbi:DUF805 domain-containing protein [Amorphus sp. 3PC139-8]|uniref:DUF805 domain-containing protein n=1 Tax=Amorphus sp. 3PC139-8 TaxID=2735676 RepID=UPI00345DE39F